MAKNTNDMEKLKLFLESFKISRNHFENSKTLVWKNYFPLNSGLVILEIDN